MSLLNQLFNRGVFGTRCKTCLNLAISRIKLLQNKRDVQLKQMCKEISQFLQAGQEAIARIRVEHIIREQNIWAAYEILELFCEFVLARVPIIENQRECPSELREAIASIIFAAPRCSDVPDLLHIKNLFTTKYGKEFVSAVSELRPDSGVNRTIIEKLSVTAPSGEVKLKVLREIAEEYNIAWDSSKTEAEFRKNHEDLLGGAKQVSAGATLSHTASRNGSNNSTSRTTEPSNKSVPDRQEYKQLEAPSLSNNNFSLNINEIEQSHKNNDVPAGDAKSETRFQSSDVLEKARAAIASADRASAAARAATALVQSSFGSLKLEGK
ncbi:IST1 homolog [Vigna unguiculata]|uniref:DNA mismatch repair protein MSH2 n=1 Tax=Vigna unguiculata TaxID=3917 RepID=A0A4D6N7V3_VIGUN|nr:IST1 homolog [Vigna unguiculata]QCE08619.1 DNA mismatch repair protein MSH2 [Vigna unguiculata]